MMMLFLLASIREVFWEAEQPGSSLFPKFPYARFVAKMLRSEIPVRVERLSGSQTCNLTANKSCDFKKLRDPVAHKYPTVFQPHFRPAGWRGLAIAVPNQAWSLERRWTLSGATTVETI